MLAPGVPQVLEEFDITNNQLATFVVSVFVLGFALGPIVIAPLSEVYGRNMVYHVCNATFTVFTIACALATNIGMLIAFRFLAGFSGVAVLTIGSGSIVDMMPANRRGRAMALWTGGPILGPVVGPICGGFLVEDLGWRWVFWVIAIAVRPLSDQPILSILSKLTLRTVWSHYPGIRLHPQRVICSPDPGKKGSQAAKGDGQSRLPIQA